MRALGSHGKVGEQSDGPDDSLLWFRRQQQGGKARGAEGAEEGGRHLVVARQVDQQPEGLQGDRTILPGMGDTQESGKKGRKVLVPIRKNTDIGESKQQLAQ